MQGRDQPFGAAQVAPLDPGYSHRDKTVGRPGTPSEKLIDGSAEYTRSTAASSAPDPRRERTGSKAPITSGAVARTSPRNAATHPTRMKLFHRHPRSNSCCARGGEGFSQNRRIGNT